MGPRKVPSMLSRDEKRLVYMYRVMIPFAQDMLMFHAKSYAKLSAKLRGPVPGNLLMFPRIEAAGRAGSDRIGEDKGEASPSRPDAS